MPKSMPINPEQAREKGYDKLLEIKTNQYKKNAKLELESKNFSKEDLIEIYKLMVISRKFDEMLLENKLTNSFKKVEYKYDGPLHVSIGQEATSIGQAWLLDKEDFLYGTHRNHADVLAKGLVSILKSNDNELEKIMENYFDGLIYNVVKSQKKWKNTKEKAMFFFLYGCLAEIFTKKTGFNKGMAGSMHMFFTPFGVYPNNAIVGASVPIGFGSALFKLINKKPGVVISNLGEGAIATGPVWETLNFAAMDQYKTLWDKPYNKRPPFMLNIVNNHYAMGGQTIGETMGNKGAARLGVAINPEQMYAERVDGNNVLAVIDAMKRQKEKALSGDGPVLTEFMTYRFEGHSSGDGAQPYRDKKEVDNWKKYDPLILYEKELKSAKLLTLEKIKLFDKSIDSLLFEVYKLAIDNKKSPFLEFEKNDQILDTMMLSHSKTDVFNTKIVETLIPFEENLRIKKLKTKARYAYDKEQRKISPIRQYQIRDAIFEAILEEAYKDPTLIIFGEEHRDWGGAYGVYQGLTESLPYHRFFNTPITEAAIVGAAVGYALCGGKVLVELMYFDFLFRAGDEISNQLAKWRSMSGGNLKIPVVIRTNIGAMYGAQHSQDYTAVISHIPGIKMVLPATPYDAKGLMTSALKSNDPIFFVETQSLYGMGEIFTKEGVPSEPYEIEIGTPKIKVVGKDITILSLGASLYNALEAVEELKKYNINAELIDARSAVPFNYDKVIQSIEKTGKIVLINNGIERNNFMRHMASTISEMAFDYLDGPPIVLGARNWIMPGAGFDKWIYPQVEDILSAINEKLIKLNGYNSSRNHTIVELERRNKKGV